MQGPDFLYFLTDKDGRSYNVVNGLVVTNSIPRPLEYTPDGWQEISIENQRSLAYFGLDRSFSIPLNFVEDGARIIKEFFYKQGTEINIYLTIMDQHVYVSATEYYYYYTRFYRGEIDLSTVSHAGPKVMTSIMEGGFPKYLKDNENTTYQIPLADQNPVKIRMTGIELFGSQNLNFVDTITYDLGNSGGSTGAHKFDIAMTLPESDGKAFGISFFAQTYGSSGFDFENQTNYFMAGDFNITNPVTVKLNGTIAAKITGMEHTTSPEISYFLCSYIKATDTSSYIELVSVSPPPGSIGLPVTYTFNDYAITVSEGDTYFLQLYMTDGNISTKTFSIEFDHGSFITASFVNTFKDTYCPNILLPDLFNKVIGLMSAGEYTTVWNLPLQPLCAITSGDWIRNIDNSFLKISFHNIWSFVNLIQDAELYVVGKQIFVTLKKDGIDYNDLMDVGEISDPVITINQDCFFNSLKIGYANQEYDDVNGKQEFNVMHEYKVPQSRIVKAMEFVSDIRADCYGIEFTRINLDGKSTTDNNSDNNVFAIHVSQDTKADADQILYRNLDMELNSSATGLLSPDTVYNLALSPKQCLYRKGAFLRSCLYWHDAEKLVFQTTDKNAEVSVSYPGSPVVTEKADVQIGSMGNRYFIPLLIEGTAPTPDNILNMLEQNPKKTVQFSIQGTVYKGIPMKTGIQPETNAAQAFQIMSAPDNEILKLINYYG